MISNRTQNIKDSVFYRPEFFHNDPEILLVFQKVERMCGAIFLVTRLIEDSQLIKRTVQESAILSFRECTLLVAEAEITSQKLKNLSLSLTVLYAYLDSAFWSGLLSQMNSSVIQKEIHSTVNLIGRLDEKYKNSTNPTNSFLALLEKNSLAVSAGSAASAYGIKDGQKDTNKIIKDTIKDNVVDVVKDSNNGERVAKIRALLKDFKPRSVKDIAALFPEVSEKTIQREINKLIGQGAMKRIGDRRWSTYILV
jgi:hypothetical protein